MAVSGAAIYDPTNNLVADVKPGSTAAVAADQALVVTMHPSSSSAGAGTALTNDVGIQYRPNATGAATIAKIASAATTNATSVKASAGRVLGWSLTNTSAAFKYVAFFNKASAPTVGTDSPAYKVGIPASSTVIHGLEGGGGYSLGIAYAITGAAADLDATAVALNDVVGVIWYA